MTKKKQKPLNNYVVTVKAEVCESEEETYNLFAPSYGEAIKEAMDKFGANYVINDIAAVEIEVEKR